MEAERTDGMVIGRPAPARHPAATAAAASGATGTLAAPGAPDVVGALDVVRAHASVAEVTSWAAHERTRALAAVDAAQAALIVLRSALLRAEESAGTWRTQGDRSMAAWRARTGTGDRAARHQVAQAEMLASMPAVATALGDGRIVTEHADVLAQVARTASQTVRDALASAAGQTELVAWASEQDAGTFARTAARWAAAQDPQHLERDHQAQRAARYLHLSDTPGGTVLRGMLDRMTGHRVRLALEAVSARPTSDDERTPDQRRVDALAALAEGALGAATTSPGAAVTPHVSVILSEETWVALREERAARRDRAAGAARTARRADGAGEVDDIGQVNGDGEGNNVAPDGRPAPPATLEDGTPVPPSEVARILCDCALTRIVMDAEGAPLDLGRTQRLYTGPQRRAVIARDRTCGWPGCSAHARWCEIHHQSWWDRDDGPTSVENGVLLCSFHHHRVHEHDLVLVRQAAHEHPEGTLDLGMRYGVATRSGDPWPRCTPQQSGGPQVGGPPGARQTDESPPLTDAARPTDGRPPLTDAARRTDERPPLTDADLERVEDPVTGMSIARFLLTG